MSEFRRTVEITNSRGLHARASAKFVTYVSKLPEGLHVKVGKDGTEVTGTSIMGLMML
ncbi:MAG: HPr family phosphocarrier protein, partial [Parasphingorhabdus sp.]